MAKEDKFEVTGTVCRMMRGAIFDVVLENGHHITCNISGKLRMNRITIVEGDHVTVSMSPYDLQKGTIIWRRK